MNDGEVGQLVILLCYASRFFQLKVELSLGDGRTWLSFSHTVQKARRGKFVKYFLFYYLICTLQFVQLEIW